MDGSDWSKQDALNAYHEACALAAGGHGGLRMWFNRGTLAPGGCASPAQPASAGSSVSPAAYREILARKAHKPHGGGISDAEISEALLPIQRACAEFALRVGRAGIFLATGFGKSLVQLEYSGHAAAATNGRALILAPLAVAVQFEREAAKFGYEARVIRTMSDVRDGINICNYDRFDKVDPNAFGSVCLDEGSAIKAFGGKTTMALTNAFAGHRFRLSATATPAPNDHMELGTQAEFLGLMAYREMLSRWFINDTSSASQKWRLKGHAHADFWDWVASWARMAVMPSDMGFSDDGYELPPLKITRHKPSHATVKAKDGDLFAGLASATSIYSAKRQTVSVRADKVAELVHAEPGEPWVCWCDTNDESTALAERIPGAVEVRGSMSIEAKEAAIRSFLDREARVLITKPSICGWGLNLQHCARTAFVGRTFSYEAWHQAVRRFHRFGQTREVHVHIVVDDSERQADEVIARKEADHKRMQAEMAAAMARSNARTSGRMIGYTPNHSGGLPSWLSA